MKDDNKADHATHKSESAKEFLKDHVGGTYKEYSAWCVSNKTAAEAILGAAYFRKLKKKAEAEAEAVSA